MSRRAVGEGSIVQRDNGRWQASLQIDGHRRTVYGKTRQEASAKLDVLKRQANAAGTLPTPGKRTVSDLLDVWLAVKAPTLKPRTLADYRMIADTLIRPTLGDVALARLGPDRIARLYAGWQAEGKHKTALKAHRVLSAALALAVRWAWLGANPCDRVDVPRYSPQRKAIWSKAELRAFLAATSDHWLYPFWLTALGSGLRLGELLALEWGDVVDGVLSVTKSAQVIGGQRVVTTPKTRAGIRKVKLPQKAVAALQYHRATQAATRLSMGAAWSGGDLVFTTPRGAPLSASTAGWALSRYCELAGVPRVTPHGLRHLHASLLLAGGLPVTDVSARLGHGTPAVTLRVYAHAIGRDDSQAADVVSAALASEPGKPNSRGGESMV